MNLFEKATRYQYRFKTTRGLVSVEDLWAMKLPALNSLAQGLYREAQQLNSAPDFLGVPNANDPDDVAERLEVVKRILEVKVSERDTAKAAAETRAQKELLTEILHKKRMNALEDLSVEELEARIAGAG